METVTLDFETRYGKNYSLTKSTTSEYLHDNRFFVFGVGIKFNDRKTEWYPHEEINGLFSSINWDQTALIAHNCRFEAAILKWRYGCSPLFYIDTLALAKADCHYESASLKAVCIRLFPNDQDLRKGDELILSKDLEFLDTETEAAISQYCIQDVELCHHVYKKLYANFPYDEAKLIDLTIRMYVEPSIYLDTQLLTRIVSGERQAKKDTLKRLKVTSTQLASNQQFAQLLEDEGITDIPTKISKTTGKSTYAFAKADAGFQELLKSDNKRVVDLTEGRIQIKSPHTETRATRLLTLAYNHNGLLPIALNYYGAHTGRFSGTEKINIQNFQRGSELRRTLLAPPNHVLVTCDSAQIEARVLAWLAGETSLLNQFKNKEDVYKNFAAKIYKKESLNVSSTERFVAKTCILGLGYGMGPKRFQETLSQGTAGPPIEMSIEEATNIVSLYREEHPWIKHFWKHCQDKIPLMDSLGLTHTYNVPNGEKGIVSFQYHSIYLPNGMYIKYSPERFQSNNFNWKAQKLRLHGGVITENIVQALARIIITDQILNINDKYPVAFSVHDEVTAIAPTAEAKIALEDIIDIMRIPPRWATSLPLNAEGVYSNYYAK
jgi:DNA polymerase